MTKTEMLETMKRLDAHANALLLIGASDIDLLGGMFDVMPDFKALLDAGYGEEIERNAGRFPGLHRYAVMLSNIAEGIADGSKIGRAHVCTPDTNAQLVCRLLL